MKFFAIVNRGFEAIAIGEIKKLGGSTDINQGEGIITFESDKRENVCKLAYLSQSISKICVSIANFPVTADLKNSVNNLKKQLKNFDPTKWSSDSFAVECERNGNHDFNSHDFELAVCKLLGKNVNFKSPTLRFYCLIDKNQAYFGIDIAGFDLSKRDYRIFGHSSDLKATAAYSLIILSGYNSEKTLVDPFSRSGAIAIEAALFAAKFPVNYYRKDSFSFLHLKPFSKINFDKLFATIDNKIKNIKPEIYNCSSVVPYIKSAEKNAKIAGVNKLINFTRADLEYLDLKFEKREVDLIVSYPPMISRTSNADRIKKHYNEMFYQADYILKKTGRVVLASREAENLVSAASKNNFKLFSKTRFSMGAETRLALTFVKE